MLDEVNSAVDFLSNILLSSRTFRTPTESTSVEVNQGLVDKFRQHLETILCSHYQNHWFPDRPYKGSAYRCLRINGKMDPLLAQAGKCCGLSVVDLYSIFPCELTMWIDPKEVSYRIGEEGSVGVIYQAESSSQSDPAPAQFQSSIGFSSQHCSFEVPSFRPDTVNMEYLAQQVN